MNTDLKEKFDRNIRAKAGIGMPFTMEDVADTLGVKGSDLRSSWLVPFRDADVIRNVGTQLSRSKKHHVTVWQGTYYLDLEKNERLEAQAELLAEYEQEHGVITQEEMDALAAEMRVA